MTEYTITDLTATTPAATPEPRPERPTAKQDLIRFLNEWEVRHGLTSCDAVGFGTDDGGDLTITLSGLTLEGDDIVPNEKEFEYEATILVEVTVRGATTARNEDDAMETAEITCEDAEFDIDASGLWVTSWDIQSVSVDEVEEA